MDGGTDATTITTLNGMVNVSRIDCYYDYAEDRCANEGPDAAPEITQSQAHTYGELTRGQRRCPYTTDQDIYSSPQNCTYFYNRVSQEFAYRFAEYNPDDRASAYPYLTKRIVRASADNCHEYSVSSMDAIDSPDGEKGTWVFNYYNQTFNGSLPIPKPSAAFDASTYVYNGLQAP